MEGQRQQVSGANGKDGVPVISLLGIVVGLLLCFILVGAIAAAVYFIAQERDLKKGRE